MKDEFESNTTQVPAAMADAYNRELDRTQKCYDKLQAAAPAESQ